MGQIKYANMPILPVFVVFPLWHCISTMVIKSKESIMMTIRDFNQLTFERKCDFVTLFGTHLISKSMGENNSHVYQLGNFFVEMWYDQHDSNLLGINAIETMGALDMYLDEISLVDILAYIKQQ